jgi:arylsulfatase A-like enzyme
MKLKNLLLALPFLLLSVAAGAQPQSIVMIVADDLRDQDIQYLPSVQRLAAEGVRFTSAVTPYPLCTPSRVSLLTGLTPERHGAYVNDYRLIDPSWPTLGTRFKEHGWRTGVVGKFANNKLHGVPIPRYPGWDTWQVLVDHDDFGRDQTKVLANRGADFLRDCRTDQVNCFLYLAPAAPHGPNPGPVECDAVPVPPKPVGVSEVRWNQRLSSICGLNLMVEKILRQSPTWVIFLSDNGYAMSNGKLGKNELLFDSVRVPLVVHGPGLVPQSREELVSLMDIHALALDLAGFAAPLGIDGKTMRPLLEGSTERWLGRITIEAF